MVLVTAREGKLEYLIYQYNWCPHKKETVGMNIGMHGDCYVKNKAEPPRQAPLFINCLPAFCSQDGVLDYVLLLHPQRDQP